MRDINFDITDRNGEVHHFEIPSDCGLNLMELCKSAELGVEGICGGMALCGSCQIYIEDYPSLPAKTEDEEKMLETIFFVQSNSRLACQIKINENLEDLSFTIAPSQ